MIVDASVAFKWLVPETGSSEAIALIGQEELLAPNLLLIELGNAIWKKAVRNEIDADASFEPELENIGMLVRVLDEAPVVPRALTIARTLGHAIYDCVYLAMAEAENMRLVTADGRFFRKVQASPWAPMIGMLA